MKPGGYSSISALCISRPVQDASPPALHPPNLGGALPMKRPPRSTSPSSDGWGCCPPPLVNVRDAFTPPPHSGLPSGLPLNQLPSAILSATSPVLTPPSPTPSTSPPPLCFTTDTECIAHECNKHWSGIFDKKDVDLSEMNSLFCDVKDSFSHNLDALLPDP